VDARRYPSLGPLPRAGLLVSLLLAASLGAGCRSAPATPDASERAAPPPRRSRLPGRGARAAAPGQAELEAALAAARAGDLGTARAKSEAAIEKNPRIEQAYLLLGSTCAMQGNDACEAAAYERGLATLPKSVALQREMGFLRLRRGEIEAGIRQLEAARDASAEVDPGLLADLAVAYEMAGDLDRARATASAAVEADPGCVSCHLAAGEIALAGERFSDAEAAFARAVQKAPRNVEARRSRAKAVFLSGDLPRAVELYLDLARRAPEDVRVRVQTAQVLMRAKRPADAVPHLRAASELLPEEARLLDLLAEAEAEAGLESAAEATRARAAALRAK
jgi:tetratricopeptide (TPR) repeat protein